MDVSGNPIFPIILANFYYTVNIIVYTKHNIFTKQTENKFNNRKVTKLHKTRICKSQIFKCLKCELI